MPLDRRITIKVQSEGGYNEYGEYQEGTISEYPVWAQRSSAGAADSETEGGIVVVEAVNWTVRWFRELEVAPPSRIHVVDEYGSRWNVDTVSESNQRRRFMYIQSLREAVD